MIKIKLYRYSKTEKSTLGLLFDATEEKKFICYTLEDPYQEKKIKGNTCIPKGKYKIKLRTEGGLTKKYQNKYPDIHKGMLWLQDVDNFQYVYIHTGNSPQNTNGCILVGNMTQNNKTEDDFVGLSTKAYVSLYKLFLSYGEDGEIEIIDLE